MIKNFVSVILATAMLPTIAWGGARRFTYVYETTTAPPGAFELESLITWSRDREDRGHFSRLDFRHEIEFGITDRFQASVYLPDWSYRSRKSFDEGAVYTGSAIELIYNLTNPETSAIGSALYGELKVGERLVSLESKVLIQKDLGRLVLAYNASLEAEWAGRDLEERTGEFQETLGASYEVKPQLLIGAEFLHEVQFPEWRESGKSVVSAGPNVSVRVGKWWATATVLAQLSDVAREPNVQVRTIFGYTF
ncbi:MAG: hypothetical protein M3Z22_05500 [Verrucomicrobiota bacterium]|nr:hypothetical protein [Verrucomicrobiota bacterium]